jgi:hypothetical protein
MNIPQQSGAVNFNDKVDEKVSCGRVFKAVTFSDTAEFTIESTTEGNTKYCRGFHVNADGNLKFTGADSNSEAVTLAVKEGNYYPYSVRLFWDTGTDAALKVSGKTIAAR